MKTKIIITLILFSCTACSTYEGKVEYGIYSRKTPVGVNRIYEREELNNELVRKANLREDRSALDLFVNSDK
jgi:hypothetical protein